MQDALSAPSSAPTASQQIPPPLWTTRSDWRGLIPTQDGQIERVNECSHGAIIERGALRRGISKEYMFTVCHGDDYPRW